MHDAARAALAAVLFCLAAAAVAVAPMRAQDTRPGAPQGRVLTDVEMLLAGADASRLDVVLHMLSKGVDVNARGKNGYTALMVAAAKDNRDVVELLLAKGADVNQANDEGWTALMEAAQYDHDVMVGRLIKAGAKVDAREKRTGKTVLMVAAGGQKLETVTAILAAKPDVDATSEGGLTALHHALGSTRAISTEIAAELLVAGADANHAAGDGFTPLMAAADSGELPKLTLVLSENPDVNARTGDGRTALSIAAGLGHGGMVRRLLEAGAPADAEAGSPTPLTLAVRAGSRDSAEALLAKGADANRPGRDGKTPLILAAQTGEDEIVRLLLDRSADVNGRNAEDGTTALMWAANSGFASIVDLLIERGANAALAAKDGWTAGEAARMAGHEEIARKLDRKI